MSLLCRAVVLGLILAFDLPELTLGDIKPHQGHRWGSSLSPSNAQSYPLQRTPAQPPASHTPGLTRLPQDPQDPQVKVDFQGPVRLDWHYPLVVETQIPVSPDFTLRTPTAPTGNVAVQCGENRVHVEVHQDFFSNGVMIEPAGITMGGCPVAGQNPGLLIFDYELQQCDSVIMITEDELVYTFSLVYIPEALPGTPITRADGAVVGVQCHYKRLQNVSSDAINPAWIPYASTEVAEDVLVFSLNLMTDDWAYQRPSNVYFLGDYINIEASVMVYNHIPLRIYVDHCVATQKSDVNSVPRYSFIENYGCFVDSKETVSNSRFMPRTQQNKIQFQLEAFLFQGSDLSQIYITCLLKATSASTPSDPLGKACSYTGRWVSADGNDQACGCCDSACAPSGGVPGGVGAFAGSGGVVSGSAGGAVSGAGGVASGPAASYPGYASGAAGSTGGVTGTHQRPGGAHSGPPHRTGGAVAGGVTGGVAGGVTGGVGGGVTGGVTGGAGGVVTGPAATYPIGVTTTLHQQGGAFGGGAHQQRPGGAVSGVGGVAGGVAGGAGGVAGGAAGGSGASFPVGFDISAAGGAGGVTGGQPHRGGGFGGVSYPQKVAGGVSGGVAGGVAGGVGGGVAGGVGGGTAGGAGGVASYPNKRFVGTGGVAGGAGGVAGGTGSAGSDVGGAGGVVIGTGGGVAGSVFVAHPYGGTVGTYPNKNFGGAGGTGSVAGGAGGVAGGAGGVGSDAGGTGGVAGGAGSGVAGGVFVTHPYGGVVAGFPHKSFVGVGTGGTGSAGGVAGGAGSVSGGVAAYPQRGPTNTHRGAADPYRGVQWEAKATLIPLVIKERQPNP